MPDAEEHGLAARLRRLPGQVLLALLNGTAVLVIVASVLALIASAKITHLAQTVATTMTDAVLSRVDVKPREVRVELKTVSQEMQALTAALKQKKPDADFLDPEIERLNERLTALETGVSRLGDARSALVDEVIAHVSVSLGETLQRFGACKAGAAGR